MIVQAIGLLDDLDKELNTYAMRVREWFGWHFPEMTKLVADNVAYAKAVRKLCWCLVPKIAFAGRHEVELACCDRIWKSVAIALLQGFCSTVTCWIAAEPMCVAVVLHFVYEQRWGIIVFVVALLYANIRCG